MGALKLNMGGAPAGPAGTGKTESTKDLAKALAKQCVVFNCSDGMDYLMLGRFFKGLASAGAWCCFDEFNRINIEVLSVIAQQLLTLFDAKSNGIEELIFEESKIVMKPTFSVFITMNPGYAGRTELPDNLKALFRPMAMMVPDYALIGQIMLYSFGFTEAKVLAEKMVTTFQLSSEQLSSQKHYDYGMRAVRSVIDAAGRLKREDPEANEDQLLLRALRDVNVPKFLNHDLPLFENIINDLFPGVERPQIDYGNLVKEIHNSCTFFNLQPEKIFIEKIIQLYDTILVRHGLMLVGPTGGGKTSNYKVLQHTYTALAGQGNFEKVNTHVLNPKSITMGQLYGEVDPQTTEWIDGVLAKKIEICASDQSKEKHWVMFDGPVDALWIESMNTVLDDNKKLCLNSGQIIPLTDRMTMMFEVEDLEVASPATVSRCGMVFMEPLALGTKCLFESWYHTFPPPFKLSEKLIPKIKECVNKYYYLVLEFVRKNLYEPVVTMDNNLCQSFCRIMDCYFAAYYDDEARTVQKEEIEEFEEMVESLFVYGLVWSFGCTTDLEGRRKFDSKLREILKGFKGLPPATGMVYDFCYDIKNKMWVDWLETVSAFQIDARIDFTHIIVPTFDSIRMKYIKKLLLSNKKHILCPGNTGTGKTININQLLTTEMPEEYQSLVITFSAQTSANQTQDALDEKFEKRARGVFGPAPGKRFVIFVDDLNMPKKEEYGAQPPIEFLRQWLDHGGWYDRESKEKNFRKIEDIILISAMGPPGGGRSHITARMMRHFNIITYTNLQEISIKQIFSTILKGFLETFTEEIRNSLDTIIDMTLSIYKNVATELRPTPAKSHYTFNLRDISKVFQGLCSANVKSVVKVPDLVKLWAHENYRVFRDRMVSDEDRNKLNSMINKEFTQKLGIAEEAIHGDGRIIFGDFMYGIDVEPRNYEIITDIDKMIQKMVEYLEEYNEGVKHPMRLVMFLDACDHVSRICRILRQPNGHALLLGVGGSGRQSLSKLATYISNYQLFQIEVSKGFNMSMWRDNLRECLKQ